MVDVTFSIVTSGFSLIQIQTNSLIFKLNSFVNKKNYNQVILFYKGQENSLTQ